MPSGATDPATYAGHWGRVYEEDPSARTREWHLQWADCREAVAPFVSRAAHPDGLVVDLGCGGSSMGHEVCRDFGIGRVLMTDIDPGIVEVMRERYAARRDEPSALPGTKSDGATADPPSSSAVVARCAAADARDLSGLVPSCGAAVVVDKGTLDALHGDEDKIATLRECARVLDDDPTRPGVVVSVSFASAARVALLDRVAPQLGMRWRLKVIADGDPKFGHAAVFVAVLGRETNDPALDGMFDQDPEDELTAVVLRRCREAGSLIEDEPPRPEDALTLFDEDEEEAKP